MEPWSSPPDDEHRAAYRRIARHLQELVEGNRATMQRLRADLEIVLRNEEETRRVLSREVYGVPEEWIDELLRVRLEDLDG